ncbi:MAG TPA: tetrahydrofolate dehydrogenase/cyclohydrolase catalytic domain-containing protein, partial [Acidimicrobiales bacterium]
MTKVLSGKDLATSIRQEVTLSAERLRADGIVPKLVIVVATRDPSTLSYVRSIVTSAEKTGSATQVMELSETSSAGDIIAALDAAGVDSTVHGVLLQTPLPANVDLAEVSLHIPVAKDIDGASPLSLGRLAMGLSSYAPATAEAVMELLSFHQVPLAGRSVAVVGRSTVVGKPLALLLLAADATVTVCHSKTVDLAQVTRRCEVVVAAVGQAELIGAGH